MQMKAPGSGPVVDGDSDDPLFEKIRELAGVITYVCAASRTYPTTAFTRAQYVEMIDRVRALSECILQLTGVSDVDRFEQDCWDGLGERGSYYLPTGGIVDLSYIQPYTEEAGADR